MDARDKGGGLLLNVLEAALAKGALTPTQHARRVLETATSFVEAVKAFSVGDIVNPAYMILVR